MQYSIYTFLSDEKTVMTFENDRQALRTALNRFSMVRAVWNDKTNTRVY